MVPVLSSIIVLALSMKLKASEFRGGQPTKLCEQVRLEVGPDSSRPLVAGI
jgi:hypothetical protein